MVIEPIETIVGWSYEPTNITWGAHIAGGFRKNGDTTITRWFMEHPILDDLAVCTPRKAPHETSGSREQKHPVGGSPRLNISNDMQ